MQKRKTIGVKQRQLARLCVVAFGAAGSGLVGLTDRVEALGGRLSLHSPPRAGTQLAVTLPLDGGGWPGAGRAEDLEHLDRFYEG